MYKLHYDNFLISEHDDDDVRPPHVYIDVWFTGVFLIEPVVLECSSPAARDPAISISIFRQSLKSFKQQFLLCVIVILYIYCVFLGSVMHTRFRDSFCLASVF